jgi:DNA-binding MarR family transcriptional regulator
MIINDLVLKTMTDAGKPLRPGEIAQAAGIEKADVDKAIKQLKKEEKIFSPKVCFYDVKK